MFQRLLCATQSVLGLHVFSLSCLTRLTCAGSAGRPVNNDPCMPRAGAWALLPAITVYTNLLYSQGCISNAHIAARAHLLHFTVTITYLYRYSAPCPLSSELCALRPLSAL